MPSFDRVRKTSQSERFKPSLASIKTRSRGDVEGANDVRKPHYNKYSANSLAPGYKSGYNDVVSTKKDFFFLPELSFEFLSPFRTCCGFFRLFRYS